MTGRPKDGAASTAPNQGQTRASAEVERQPSDRDLIQILIDRGMRKTRIADAVGVHASQITRIFKGEQQASPETHRRLLALVESGELPAGALPRDEPGAPLPDSVQHQPPDISVTHGKDEPVQRQPLVDIKQVAADAVSHLEAICAHWLPDGKRQGHDWVARNPTRDDQNAGSFSVSLITGGCIDHATGEQCHDIVSTIKYLEGLPTQGEAARLVADFLGTAPRPEPTVATRARPAPKPMATRPTAHPRLGLPSRCWEYPDQDRNILCVVMRFETADGKQFRPLTPTPDGWIWKAPAEPRPLYGLDRLAARPDAAVILCEGEKAADAAGMLLPEGATIASMNGAQSPKKTDWTPLKGRVVRIWPDADEPGAQFARTAAALIRAAGAASVSILDLSSLLPELPAGWDAADALADGWTAERLARQARWSPYQPDSGPDDPQDFDAYFPAGAEVDPPRDGTSALIPPANVHVVPASMFKPVPIDWIWPGWLARGKVEVLAGAPGTGKTSIVMALAATLTIGGRWPDGTRATPGHVLIWSGEDDPTDTLVPRLMAAGANLDRVHIVSGMTDEEGIRRAFDPSRDARLLAAHVARMDPAPVLLIVDPLVSAVAGDSHKNAEVRRALQPLVDLGMESRCCVVGISHFSKGSSGRDPVERVTGSLAFGALARIVLATAKLPDEEGGGRILARGKSNIGADSGGFAYELEVCTVGQGIETTRVLWGDAVEGSARELLGQAETQTDPDERSALDDAKGFLRMMLERGPVSAKQIKKEAAEAGHAERTLMRAKQALGVEARKEDFHGQWRWALPAKDAKDAQGCHVSETRKDGILREVWHPSGELRASSAPQPAASEANTERETEHEKNDIGHVEVDV